MKTIEIHDVTPETRHVSVVGTTPLLVRNDGVYDHGSYLPYGIKYALECACPIYEGLKSKRAGTPFKTSVFARPVDGSDTIKIHGDSTPCDIEFKKGRRTWTEPFDKYDEWQMEFILVRPYWAKYSWDQIFEILKVAGTDVGIGQRRPFQGGTNGMFTFEL